MSMPSRSTPTSCKLGKEYNPEHAYQSPRVTIHIDDGRSFLQDTNQRYSLILYALPDSLTALTGQSAPVGLENYLLTTQGIQVAKDHLAPGGTFVMYNYYQPFLLDRYATALDSVFGLAPVCGAGKHLERAPAGGAHGGVVGTDAELLVFLERHEVAPVSDDRPFPYLPTPSIPILYLLVMGLILAASVRGGADRGRAVQEDGAVRGPVLDGGGVLAARSPRTSCSSPCSSARRGT